MTVPTASVGELLIRRFNGDERYDLETATLTISPEVSGLTLYFDAEAVADPSRALEDSRPLNPKPRVELTVRLPDLSPEFLARGIDVPFDPDDYPPAMIYYAEHDVLQDVKFSFLGIKQHAVHASWAGWAEDVIWYDGSKPKCQIIVTGWFQLSRRGIPP